MALKVTAVIGQYEVGDRSYPKARLKVLKKAKAVPKREKEIMLKVMK